MYNVLMKLKYDLTGQKFGSWAVLHRGKNDLGAKAKWTCQCECGTIKDVSSRILRSGKSKSYGCKTNELKSKSQIGSKFKDEFEAHKRFIYRNYKYGAKKRGYEFKISFENFCFLLKQRCYYCGAEPSNKQILRNAQDEFLYNGIDRKDNSKGYIKDNCVSACSICNRMKLEMSDQEFLLHVAKIIDWKLGLSVQSYYQHDYGRKTHTEF